MMRDSLITPNAFSLEKLGDAVMVTSDSLDDIIIVNDMGAKILEYIQTRGTVTVSDILGRLYQEYDAIAIEEDICGFLDQMIESGVIKIF